MNNEYLLPYLLAGNGKLKSNSIPVDSYLCKTLRLKCTPETGILALDVDVVKDYDNPNYVWNVWLDKLQSFIKEDDLISYSDEYTLEDVRNSRCHFKVFFIVDKLGTYTNPKEIKPNELIYNEYNFYTDDDLAKDKNGVNKNGKFINKIELFYGNNTTPAFFGKRDSNSNYILHGTLQHLDFELQDVLPYKVKYNKSEEEKPERKIKNKVPTGSLEASKENPSVVGSEEENVAKNVHIDTFQDNNNQYVGTEEFKEIIAKVNEIYNMDLKIKNLATENDRLLSFKCLFPDAHNDMRFANAYAFKRDGLYILKCQGQVCSGEYTKLNRLIKSLQSYPDLKGYRDLIDGDKQVTMFKSYTGWGKTERIADGIIEHLKDDTPLLVILPNIDNIQSIIRRVYDRLDDYQCSLDPLEDGKIYLHYAEQSAKFNDEAFMKMINHATVIITHHQYFGLSGDIMSWYPRTKHIINLNWDEIYIDEGHAFLEHCTTHDLEIGGVYKHSFGSRWEKDNKSWSKEDFDLARSENKIVVSQKCCELRPNSYGQLKYTILNELSTKLEDEYINLYSFLIKNWTPIYDYVTDDYHRVQVLENPHKSPILTIDTKELPMIESNKYQILTQGAESVIITTTLPHPEKNRKTIGRVIARFTYRDILKEIVNNGAHVVLTSGTYYPHHYKILESALEGQEYNRVDIDEDMSKVKNITVLHNLKDKRNRDNFVNYLDGNSDFNFLYVTQTISNANRLIKQYHNYTHNHNGVYMYTKPSNGEVVKHNVTVFSLESAVSKGYNFTEELYGDGFDAVYFDGRGVSPIVNKLYMINGELISIEEDYEIGNLSQSLGRAFRKDKDNMVVIFNNIDEGIYEQMVRYLRDNTNANINIEQLSLTAITHALKGKRGDVIAV